MIYPWKRELPKTSRKQLSHEFLCLWFSFIFLSVTLNLDLSNKTYKTFKFSNLTDLMCKALRLLYVIELNLKMKHWPRGQYLRRLEVRHHIEEVVAEEDPPLCQEDSETDRIPDDAGFTCRQLTFIIGISWKAHRVGEIRLKNLQQILTNFYMTENISASCVV